MSAKHDPAKRQAPAVRHAVEDPHASEASPARMGREGTRETEVRPRSGLSRRAAMWVAQAQRPPDLTGRLGREEQTELRSPATQRLGDV